MNMRIVFIFVFVLTAGFFLQAPRAFASTGKQLEIVINKDAVLIGDTRVRLDELQAQLQKISQQPGVSEDKVLIKAGSAKDYSEVVTVLDAVHKAGFNQIALVTDSTTTKKD